MKPREKQLKLINSTIKGNNIQEFFFIKTVMRMCAFQMQHDKYSANSQVDQVNQEMVS
jgi:hypothetical protein